MEVLKNTVLLEDENCCPCDNNLDTPTCGGHDRTWDNCP